MIKRPRLVWKRWSSKSPTDLGAESAALDAQTLLDYSARQASQILIASLTSPFLARFEVSTCQLEVSSSRLDTSLALDPSCDKDKVKLFVDFCHIADMQHGIAIKGRRQVQSFESQRSLFAVLS